MGIVTDEFAFPAPAPSLARIAQRVAERTGLAVAVVDSPHEVKSDFYDLHGTLAFALAAGETLKVSAYRAGVVRAAAGEQAVHLQGYVGQDLTLMAVTGLALESLGGQPREPITAETRREFGGPIDAAAFLARRRRERRRGWAAAGLVVLASPLLVPLGCVYLAALAVVIPWQVCRAAARATPRT